VTSAQLAQAIQPHTKMLLLSYPNNPTGAVMDREHMLQVARLAQERGLIVISDEIYDQFVYGVEHSALLLLPGMWERTVLLADSARAML
jgi:aminotransferase